MSELEDFNGGLPQNIADAVREYAGEYYGQDGDLEFDDGAVISSATDGSGAYVQCWKWIYYEDAGLDVNEEGIIPELASE